MTLQLILVRHGETEWTERGLLHGARLDAPLSAAGRRHAELTAAALRGQRYDALYSSPQGRAMETARILGQALGLEPRPVEGLREADFGWLEGKSLLHFDPDGTGARLLRPLARAALRLTAERPGQISRRVGAALAEMLHQHPSGRLLIVTHWRTLSQILAELVDRAPSLWERYQPWTACSLTELHATDGGWQILRLNDSTHLIPHQQPVTDN